MKVKVLVAKSYLALLRPHGLQPARLLCPRTLQARIKNTGVGSHSLLQGIFLTQVSNLGLLHCGQILYHLSHQYAYQGNAKGINGIKGKNEWKGEEDMKEEGNWGLKAFLPQDKCWKGYFCGEFWAPGGQFWIRFGDGYWVDEDDGWLRRDIWAPTPGAKVQSNNFVRWI